MSGQIDQVAQQIGQINKSLEGTLAQLDALNRKIEDSSKNFMENLAEVNENMRLILEVIKKQRANVKEDLGAIHKDIKEEIDKLWKENALKTIAKDELEAIEKLRSINTAVGDNLYMAQLMAIIQSLREISGRAMQIRLQKK